MAARPSTIIQTGIGLDHETLARCDRLRACYGRSRSWVIERALNVEGLRGLEQEMAGLVQRFDALAANAGHSGMAWQQYAQKYVEAFGAKTYPPTVEVLEEINFTGHETAAQLERKLTKHGGRQRAARIESIEKESRQRLESDVHALVSEAVAQADAESVPLNGPRGLRDLR